MKKEIDFIAKRKIFFTISIILIAVSILSSFVFGVDLDIQFKGGTIINYAYDGDIDVTEFTSKASEALDGITVNAATGTDFTSNRNSITLSLITKSGLTSEKQFDLTNALTEAYADNNLDLISSSDVSPSAGSEFFKKCLVAVGFASVVLIIYIAFRFKKISGWSAGVIAVIALLHDIIVTYGTFVICRMEIDANFMAVVLTILGYSINNTIVIYDRIRENERLYGKKKSRNEIVNMSINQSMTRSIHTTVSTLIAMVVITIVALAERVDSIISFSFPLIIGIISGFYSSVCLAGPLWTWLNEKIESKKGSVKTA